MKRAFLLLLSAAAVLPGHAAEPLKLTRTIPLPGVEGRIDHLSVDLAGRRLFVAALGNNTVEVVDLIAGQRTLTVKGLHEPQGVLFVPQRNRIYVANGEDGKLTIFEGTPFRPLHTIGFSGDADNLRYDVEAKRVYVGYGSGALGIVDIATARKVGDIPLDGHPESFQLERSGTRIFVNVPSAGHIAVVDRRARAVTLKWPLPGRQENFPMALDEDEHRLFAGCRKPAHVAVLDTNSGKVLAQLDCVGDTDDLFYDAALRRLYVSGGEGFLSVFQEQDPDHYTYLAKIPAAAGARTSLFVPDLKRFYLAVPHCGAQAAAVRVYETQP
jgi:DNA-binding beta-propeller fold protein YncE